jgi:hypothetical protein
VGHPAPGFINTVYLSSRLGVGHRPTTCRGKKKEEKKLVGNLNCCLGTVTLSGIDLSSGKGLVELRPDGYIQMQSCRLEGEVSERS